MDDESKLNNDNDDRLSLSTTALENSPSRLSPSRYELRTPPRSSSQRRQLDLTLLAGQKVVKKYRRYARNNEFRRLKALVPSLLKKNEASKTEILEETIRYIDSLHEQLIATFRSKGLPTSLRQSLEANKGLLNLNDDKSVIESVQTMLLPGIERRVAAKKRLEDLAISTLVENVTLLQQSNLPSDSDFQTASESENLSSQEPQPSCSSSHNAE